MPKRFMALNARWMKDAEDFVQIVAASILHTGRARMPRFGLNEAVTRYRVCTLNENRLSLYVDSTKSLRMRRGFRNFPLSTDI